MKYLELSVVQYYSALVLSLWFPELGRGAGATPKLIGKSERQGEYEVSLHLDDFVQDLRSHRSRMFATSNTKQNSDNFLSPQGPLLARKARLENAERLKKFHHDVEDEEAWIREKEPIVSSPNTGGVGWGQGRNQIKSAAHQSPIALIEDQRWNFHRISGQPSRLTAIEHRAKLPSSSGSTPQLDRNLQDFRNKTTTTKFNSSALSMSSLISPRETGPSLAL